MHRTIYLTSPMPGEGIFSLPVIDFRLLADNIDYQGCDTLMFTSKQAVESAENIDPNWKRLPSIAIGAATASRIELLGGDVIFHPADFYGEELAQDILDRFVDRSVLYLRPLEVSFDSKSYLARAGYDLKEQIIYETYCKQHNPHKKPPSGSIIIFTSPSTIHCFLDTFGWNESYTAVVIGKTTAKHLPDGADFTIADEPLIDACITKARSLS